MFLKRILIFSKQVNLGFMLEDNKGNSIGCVDLFDYCAIDRRSAIGIIIDEKYRSIGYGAEAISLMKDYALTNWACISCIVVLQ